MYEHCQEYENAKDNMHSLQIISNDYRQILTSCLMHNMSQATKSCLIPNTESENQKFEKPNLS